MNQRSSEVATLRCSASSAAVRVPPMWLRAVNPSMIHGASSHAAADATTRTTSETVATAEMDFHARRSPSRASRSMNTGTKVAEAMPPSTTS